VLTVAMPTTPGQTDLPGVVEEVSRITGLIKKDSVVQSSPGPTTEEVLGQLEHHDIVHFACHGLSNLFDPSESCLLLQRRQPSDAQPISDPLTVGQVAHLRLMMARIAFLSACSTAESKVEQLTDEVIHLASGFQVAGFAHLISWL
jgi:CHAT domain-containing protein